MSMDARQISESVPEFLRILHPDGVFEVRAPKAGKYRKTFAGYYRAQDVELAAKHIAEFDSDAMAPAIYVTLNPVLPDLLGRKCRDFGELDTVTRDEEITLCRNLLVDFDTTRPSGVSATDAEVQQAIEAAETARDALSRDGWPDPLVVMSGNGAHLIYRVELPNNAVSRELRTAVPQALAQRFNIPERVTVDTAVFNAARITKIAGTMARKGDDLKGIDGVSDRPHRRAWFEVPQRPLQVVPTALLEKLAAEVKQASPMTHTVTSQPTTARPNAERLTAIDRCIRYIQKCPDAVSGRGGHNALLLMACETFRFGLDRAQARQVLDYVNATKTGGEPFSDREIEHKLDDALAKVDAAGEFGIRLRKDTADVVPGRSSGGVGGDSAQKTSAPPEDWRPMIVLGPDEHRVVDESICALRSDPGLFCRGNVLVHVLPSGDENNRIKRVEGSHTITQVPMANLRDRLTRYARFVKPDREGDLRPAHPPNILAPQVEARGNWPGMRELHAISSIPVLRPDGSIFQTPGYDAKTGVLYKPSQEFPTVHPEASIDDAQAAVKELMEVFEDFLFEDEEHRAAALAAMLTVIGRHAFDGPAPLFLFDANIRAAGKGLLAQCCGRLGLGREIPVSSYSHDTDEMRKVITTAAIGGDQVILLDNVEGAFGNDALDRVLTTTRWKDRLLGINRNVDLPFTAVWFATGNNVQVAADTARRIIHIRLDVPNEQPENRDGFRHKKLLGWISENRPRLLTAALTILSAYLRAGSPKDGLVPFGSFEGWSSVVREAVVWTGLPDPCKTRVKLVENCDTTADSLGQLITAWREYFGPGEEVVVTTMLSRLYPPDRMYIPSTDAATAMRAALEAITGIPPGKVPSSRQVGNRLRQFRRRTIGGAFLYSTRKGKNGTIWMLGNHSGGDSGDSGDCSSPLPARENDS